MPGHGSWLAGAGGCGWPCSFCATLVVMWFFWPKTSVLFTCSEFANLKLDACIDLRCSLNLVLSLLTVSPIFCITILAFDVVDDPTLILI